MADPTPIHPRSLEPATSLAPARNRRRRSRSRLGGLTSLVGIAVAALAIVLTQPGLVVAQRSYLTVWSTTYPASVTDNNASCTTCHGAGNDTSMLNAYGASVFNAGTNAAGFKSIESADSDGDGTSNIAEINAGSQPGWRAGANNTLVDGKNFVVLLTFETAKSAKEFEYHDMRDHVFYVLDGTTVYEIGGMPKGAHATKPGEWLAPESEGAVTYRLKKGDMLVIPRGTPHKRMTEGSVTLLLVSPISSAKP